MSNLILVGTVHVDHKGHERLERALHRYKPSIICLEESREGATTSWKNHLDAMRRWDEIKDRVNLIYSPEQVERLRIELTSSFYETWVPKVYKNGSPDVSIYCLDKPMCPEFSTELGANQRSWIINQLARGKSIQDLLSPIDTSIKDFIEKGSIDEHQSYVDRVYDETDPSDFISHYGIKLFKIATTDRDQRFAQQIRKLHSDNSDKTIVAFLGNMHIFGNYLGNTYELLSDLCPERIKLKDVDRF
jgi:hypothetical protein